MTARWLITILWVLGSGAGDARAESRCVGWAIGGEVAGLAVGSWATLGGYAVADSDINSSSHEVRNGTILGSAMFVGGTAGSIGACAAFGHERHAIPRLSFSIASAFAVGVPAYLATRLALDPGGDPSDPNTFSRREGAGGLSAIAGVLGLAGGALAGYYLHGTLFGTGDERPYVAPMVSRGVTALVLGGRF